MRHRVDGPIAVFVHGQVGLAVAVIVIINGRIARKPTIAGAESLVLTALAAFTQ